MKVTVLFFAALRERVGRAREEFELPPGVDTVDALRAWLVAAGKPGAKQPEQAVTAKASDGS
jgi:molybdopterin converting factor small subunit